MLMSKMYRWLPSIGVMTLIFLLSHTDGDVIDNAGLGNESLHIVGHFFIFFILFQSYYYATKNAFHSFLLTVAYAVFDEFHQSFVANRSPGSFDVLTDSFGGLLGYLLIKKGFGESYSLGGLRDLASKMAKEAKPGDVYLLFGDLGSGKTTFTRFFVESLGFKSRVQSPTFVIHRIYKKEEGEIKKINHFDLYRLSSAEEVSDLGLDEIFQQKDCITLIEWPELVDTYHCEDAYRLYFAYENDEKRSVYVKRV